MGGIMGALALGLAFILLQKISLIVGLKSFGSRIQNIFNNSLLVIGRKCQWFKYVVIQGSNIWFWKDLGFFVASVDSDVNLGVNDDVKFVCNFFRLWCIYYNSYKVFYYIN